MCNDIWSLNKNIAIFKKSVISFDVVTLLISNLNVHIITGIFNGFQNLTQKPVCCPFTEARCMTTDWKLILRRLFLFIICQNYVMFPLVLWPSPILMLWIALFAVAEGWLLLDIGWFVLFYEACKVNTIFFSGRIFIIWKLYCIQWCIINISIFLCADVLFTINIRVHWSEAVFHTTVY